MPNPCIDPRILALREKAKAKRSRRVIDQTIQRCAITADGSFHALRQIVWHDCSVERRGLHAATEGESYRWPRAVRASRQRRASRARNSLRGRTGRRVSPPTCTCRHPRRRYPGTTSPSGRGGRTRVLKLRHAAIRAARVAARWREFGPGPPVESERRAVSPLPEESALSLTCMPVPRRRMSLFPTCKADSAARIFFN